MGQVRKEDGVLAHDSKEIGGGVSGRPHKPEVTTSEDENSMFVTSQKEGFALETSLVYA